MPVPAVVDVRMSRISSRTRREKCQYNLVRERGWGLAAKPTRRYQGIIDVGDEFSGEQSTSRR